MSPGDGSIGCLPAKGNQSQAKPYRMPAGLHRRKECTSWELDLPFEGDIRLTDSWNGEYTVKGNVLHIASKEYNGTLLPESTVSDIGFIAAGEGNDALLRTE